MSGTAARTAALGGRPVELGSADLGELADATADRDDRDALLARLRTDGYVRLRGFHPGEEVMRAGEDIVAASTGTGGGMAGMAGAGDLMRCPSLGSVVAGEPMMAFMSWLFGRPAMSYDFRWVRVVGRGQRTPVHCDRVFMGRGTLDLVTCWTPLTDVPVANGPIALWLGSPFQERIVATYGAQDVDRDLIDGYVAHDPWECVASMGGRWHSADFEAGDVLLFDMHTLHGSLDNTTDELRVSCDTRYQPADEPVDDRWVGDPPTGHDRWPREPVESLADGRRRWGLPSLAAP